MSAEPQRSGSARHAVLGPHTCTTCRHFDHSARTLEERIPGLIALGSGYSAVRAQDGLCALHDRYLSGAYHCRAHEASREAI